MSQMSSSLWFSFVSIVIVLLTKGPILLLAVTVQPTSLPSHDPTSAPSANTTETNTMNPSTSYTDMPCVDASTVVYNKNGYVSVEATLALCLANIGDSLMFPGNSVI